MYDDPRPIGGVRGRLVLLATAALTFVACAEQEVPQAAPYGVAESAVSFATIKFTSPKSHSTFKSSEPVDVEVTVEVTGFALGADGQIRWFVDATSVGESAEPVFTFTGVPLGAHRLGAWLVGVDGEPLVGWFTKHSVVVHVANPCDEVADCTPGHACYMAACVSHGGPAVCYYTHVSDKACCQSDLDCSYPTWCSTTGATSNKCVSCTEDAHCDDGNVCTVNSCGPDGKCNSVKPDPTCCATNPECSDGNACTVDTCDPATHTCKNYLEPGTCCVTNDCPPMPCAFTSCSMGECRYGPGPPGCCTADTACADNDSCTTGVCTASKCSHVPTPAAPNCCTLPDDCPHDGDPCTQRTCTQGKCAVTPLCNQGAVFKESFLSDGVGLEALGFSLLELGQPPQAGHWSIVETPGGEALRFAGGAIADPGHESCVVTPTYDTGDSTKLQVGWTSWFAHTSSAAPISLRVELVTAAGVSQKLWSDSPTGASGPTAHRVSITPPTPFLPSQQVALRFCVKTANTFGSWAWFIDDVFMVPGSAPTFVTSGSPQVASAGQKWWMPVKATDPDGDPLVFTVEGPSWVKKSAASYSAVDGTWSISLSGTPAAAHAGVSTVTVRVSDGDLSAAQSFNLVVKYEGGILIWAPTGATPGAAEAIRAALPKTTVKSQIQPSLAPYPDLSPFDVVLATLGVWPNAQSLTAGQAAKLAAYLQGGGRVYLEGDVFAGGLPPVLAPWFPAAATPGTGPISGLDGAGPLAGESWATAESPLLNGLVTRLESPAGVVLRSAGPDPFGVAVVHEGPGGGRAVASSFLFAGVQEGTSKPYTLLHAWLDWLASTD